MNQELLKVTSVSVVAPATLELAFSDGKRGSAELSAAISDPLGGPLAQLRDPEQFANVGLRYGVPTWNEEIDLAPEYLYFLCFRDDPALSQRFVDWGYVEPVHA